MPLYGDSGERIAYEVTPGPEGAPPIVLIHGFTASRASFLSNIPGLARRFTVVSVELLGHGESDAPASVEAYGPGPATARLRGLLDALGYDRVLLCGHSLGAALALRFALDEPDRLAGLVVLNSNSAAGTPAWREAALPGMRSMAASIREHGVGVMKETRLYPGHSKRLPPEARDALIASFESARPEGFAGTAEGLVVNINSWERLPELSVPTLVVIGDRDLDFVKNAPAFVDRLPEGLADTFTIEGAGHAANLEQPALFNAAVIGFAEAIGYIETPQPQLPAAPPGGSMALRAIGGAMVLGGASLLVAAVFIGRQGSGASQARPDATPTAARSAVQQPSPVETVSGVRTAGPGARNPGEPATPPAATASASPGTPSKSPTAPPTVTPTTARAAGPPPPPPPTATPTPSPVPSATSTPSGPYASIAGPSTVAAGAAATYIDTSQPAHVRSDWTFLGQVKPHQPGVTISFPSAPGCYPVTLTVYFADPPATKTATMNVAVGGAACP